MGFTSTNGIEIRGGFASDRRRAAEILLAAESAHEDGVSERETESSLYLRYDSSDDLPEGQMAELAAQFPELSFELAYFSLDGEFYGYAKCGAEGEAAESEDFEEDTRDLVARRHDGDRLAFVRARFSLDRG